jgi:hypothetical protein
VSESLASSATVMNVVEDRQAFRTCLMCRGCRVKRFMSYQRPQKNHGALFICNGSDGR